MVSCVICNKEAPFKCTACKSANYCSADHQKKDWPKHKVHCRPFKIDKSDELGRFLVATRDIPAKSIIFIEPPLVIGPKWCRNDNDARSVLFPCVGCFKSVPINGNRCSKCKWPICETNCIGLNDPQMHAVECLILGGRPGPTPQSDIDTICEFYRSEVLFVLRCLLLQWKFPDRWEKVMRLESHDAQRFGTRFYKEADERIVSYLVTNFWETLTNIEFAMGMQMLKKKDRTDLHRICGVMEVNALNINLGGDRNDEVSALFENACILEHSCLPNCYYTFDTSKRFKITMRAGRLIKKGEHLAIMYTNMLWGTQLRSEHLLTNKYFVCKCERCLDKTELGTYLSGMRCIGDIGKTCGGMLLPVDPINTSTDWQCDLCEVSISNEQIEIILTNIEQQVDDLMMPSGPRSALSAANFEELIGKLSNLLHENHYHLFALKHTLIQMYGHKTNCMLNEMTPEDLDSKIIMCEQLLNILDRIDPNSMRLTIYTGIVLYQLHNFVLEQNRRKMLDGATSDKDLVTSAHKHILRAKEVLSLNQDILQGRQLTETIERAENSIQELLRE